MPLNIISNFAAQVAHRNLAMSDKGASSSVAKISAGARVLGARDDAAALAIGSRLRAEVAAMTQASVNAGQAVSMLQIADGAMSQINDTLVRLKSLAVQAGSDQLGSVERGLIDTEFQQLLTEVQRISEDTEFNGQSLINGGALSQVVAAFDPGADGVSGIEFASSVDPDAVFQYSYTSSDEVLTVTKVGASTEAVNNVQEVVDNAAANDVAFAFDSSVADGAAFTYSFDQASDQFTLTNVNTGDSQVIDLTTAVQDAFGAGAEAAAIAAGESLDVTFDTLGVTVTLQAGFDFASDVTAVSTVAPTANSSVTASTIEFAGGLADADITELASLLTNGQLDIAFLDGGANAVTLSANANLSFAVDGAAQLGLNTVTGNLTDGAHVIDVYIDSDGDSTAETLAFTLNLTTAGTNGAGNVTVDFNSLAINYQEGNVGDDQVVQLDLTDQLDAVAGVGDNLQFDETIDVDVTQFGVTLTLDKGFDRTSDITTTTGALTTTPSTNYVTANTASFTPNSEFLNGDVYNALLALGLTSDGLGYDTSTGILTLQITDDGGANAGNVTLDGIAGLNFGYGDGAATGDLTGVSSVDLSVKLADGNTAKVGTFTADFTNANAAGSTTVGIRLGAGVFYNDYDENAQTNDFTFKIGTGNETFDRITLSLNSVNQQALGINGLDVTAAANADSASVAISSAIDVLNNARANVGAFQNRLDIAASNLATARENTEAARSALLDLDVAAEMTKFTSQQILVQAGVSMLAQANQLPQNLLRLLQ